MTEGPAKRRWFRYSLRTLLVVVTLLCVGLAYQANWVRQRREFVARNEKHFVPGAGWGTTFSPSSKIITAPGVLRLFGEVGHESMWLWAESTSAATLNDEDARTLQEASRLFPETKHWIFSHGDRFDGRKNWARVLTPEDVEALANRPIR